LAAQINFALDDDGKQPSTQSRKSFCFFFQKEALACLSNLIPKIPHPPAQPLFNSPRRFGRQQPPPAAYLPGAVGVVAVPLAVQIHHVSGFLPVGSENM
jgi:hypothetical protein